MSDTTPSIRYYRVWNLGAASIFPQVRDSSNSSNIVWDGRNFNGYDYDCPHGQSRIVDFASYNSTTNGKDVWLSVNVYWGDDVWITQQKIHIDTSSDQVATTTFTGGTHDGVLKYAGVAPYTGDDEVALAKNSLPTGPEAEVPAGKLSA